MEPIWNQPTGHLSSRDRWDVAAKSGWHLSISGAVIAGMWPRKVDLGLETFSKNRGAQTWAFFRCFKLCVKKCVFYLFSFLFLLCVCVLHSIFWRIKQINQDIKDSQGIFDCLESSWLFLTTNILYLYLYQIWPTMTNLDYHRIAPVGKYMHIPCSIDV